MNLKEVPKRKTRITPVAGLCGSLFCITMEKVMSLSLSRPMGRVWPDGEFVLWNENAEFEIEPECGSPLGLSKVANSHKTLEAASPRVRQGLNGITKYGQRMVRNGAYLLQKKYGPRQLAFLTCTIPGSPEETFEVARHWGEIVRRYQQELKRMLERKGIQPVIVGVTEIQPRRFERDGGMPLHLHWIFRGAVEDFRWVYHYSQYQEVWQRVVQRVVPSMSEVSFVSSTNVQRVKNSAAGYLGKYMSKGEEDIKKVLEKCPEVIDALPSTWYSMTAIAREVVKRNMVYGPTVGKLLESWLPVELLPMNAFRYIGKVNVRNESGDVVATFYAGNLEGWAMRAIGVPMDPYLVAVLD